MAMTFPAKSILQLGNSLTSEHSRAPFEVSFDQIEQANRTVNGKLRVYTVAKKHNLSVSWSMLPSIDSATVDGQMGANSLYSLYKANSEIAVKVWMDSSAAQAEVTPAISFQGHFVSHNFTVVKRNVGQAFYDFWDVSLEIEEI
jgi:hypothetical protein